MRLGSEAVLAALLSVLCLGGCSGGTPIHSPTPASTTAAPSISTAAAQNGAVVVVLASATSGATIYYTMDGSTPTASSQVYEAPFLVASNLTVKAFATFPDIAASTVTSQDFAPGIPSGTLVWSDEFSNTTGANAQPNPAVWFYSTGPADECCDAGFSVECAWDSSVSPCSAAYPNSFVDTTGYLHIVVQQPTPGVYTSAAIRTEGLFSFKYGRIEARLKLPESQAMWPAFWLMGNNVATIEWPACGESDVMEHWDGSDPLNLGYDWTQGTIHGTGFSNWGRYHAPGFIAADWHTYGMIWTPGEIEYYVDDPANIYATFTPSTQNGPWPFDAGPQFVILQVGIGGPGGAPDATTVLPSEMLVDYVRIYTN